MPRRSPGEGSISRRPNNGLWQGALQVTGKRKIVYGRTRQEVAEKLRTLQATARQNGSLPDPGTRTVADLLESWLAHAEPTLKPRTVADYRALARRYILPNIGKIKLSRLTPERLQRLYGDLQRAGLTRAPAQVHALLHRAFAVAVLWGWLPSNPADRVLRPTYRAERKEVWTARELGRFLDATAQDRHGPLWVFLATTGCRIGEALALKWDSVDPEAGTVAIKENLQRIGGQWVAQSPKTRAGERVISLPGLAVAALRRQRAQQAAWRLKAGPAWQEAGLVFSNLAGGPMGHSEPEHALARECDRLSLPRLTPHGLRHLSASLLLDRGLPLPAVSARLGHANPNITATIYGHAIKGQDRQAAEALQKALGAL